MTSKIKSIKAREILDSRGTWTVEVDLETSRGIFIDSAPSGASTGKYEAKTVTPGEAVENINNKVTEALKDKNVADQEGIDELLKKLDVGANATTAVSFAVCRAGAAAAKLPLYSYIAKLSGNKAVKMPLPSFNVINGGAHASNDIDFQEFMIVPQFKEYRRNLELASEIYLELRKKLGKNVGDEGGFTPSDVGPEQVLEMLSRDNVKIAIDAAASQFYQGGKYNLKSGPLTSRGLADYYKQLIGKYPIISLEDPFAEDDEEGWKMLGSEVLKIGDDLLVSNPERIKWAKEKNLCSGLLLKVNQIGTVSEALKAAQLAESYGWKIMVSHRSGETTDDFIADLAVGIKADFIKSGAPARGERVVKYNRLLKIEEEIL